MQLVAVDIGNSSTKVAVQLRDEDREIRWYSQTTIRGKEPIQIDLTDIPAFWSVCSVNQQRFDRLRQWISANRTRDQIHLIAENQIDIRSNVKSREQTGRDRLVAAWMALKLCEDVGPIVVVDAGTAVTIDLVDVDRVFQGGVIFPGATSALRYLSSVAATLPDLSDPRFAELLDFTNGEIIGKETQSAILKGVYHSQIVAFTEIAKKIGESTLKPYSVYATGGGVLAIEKYLPGEWQFVPDLVLRGAKAIGQLLLSEMADK